ncbi:MAG: hypothetical protein EXR89_01795 [Methylococcaceae bacterium]|nr:hypothetical protein [Methylococcaceae bacterium]
MPIFPCRFKAAACFKQLFIGFTNTFYRAFSTYRYVFGSNPNCLITAKIAVCFFDVLKELNFDFKFFYKKSCIFLFILLFSKKSATAYCFKGKKDDLARVAFLFEKYKEFVVIDAEKETPKLKK